jgi:hypothetical protein
MRGPPKVPPTKRDSKESRGQGNDLGYGNNGGNVQWKTCSQVRRRFGTDAVHRLNVGG